MIARAPGIPVGLALALCAWGAAAAEEDAGVPAVDEPAAADGTAEAKRLFEEGRRHYAAAEWEPAAADFSKAYELTHAPELLYNLARCYEHLGDAERAAAEYELYLRTSPDAEDRAEVEGRIAELQKKGGGPKAEPSSPHSKEEEAAEEEGKLPIRLALESGADVSLLSEWADTRRVSIPVDAVLLFGLNGWLQAGFGLTIAGFPGEKPDPTITGYPTGEFALHGDLAVLKTLKGRLGLTARLSVAPTWIFRKNQDNTFWLVARGGVGLQIIVWKSFGIIVEGAGGVGPVFCKGAGGNQDDFSRKISLAVDVGGRAGITYAF